MTLHLPPLAAFRAFAAVAREGSFAAAGTALHVSTSAVSHQVRALEEALGTPLFIRARNGAGVTVPTEAGQELLVAVEEALTQLSDACRSVHDRVHRTRPNLSVSANGSFASLWLAPRLAAFAGQHPSTAWHMRAIEDDAPDMLREGLDLSIVRMKQVQPPDRLLLAETLFPVCSPSLGPPERPEELLRHNLLEEASHGDSAERSWPHWLGLLGVDPSRARIVRFSSFNQASGAAIAGAGIALGRSHLVQAELAAGRLVRLFAPLALPDSAVFVLRTRPGRARDVHVEQLRDFLLSEVG
jgi:LysR family glycine cleavage system transcriptional activator